MRAEATKKLNAGETVAGWHVLEVVKQAKQTNYLCRCVCGTEKLLAGITLWNKAKNDCGCGKAAATKRTTTKQLRKDELAAEQDEVRRLIEGGFLPEADAYTVTDGEATWSFDAVAEIVGIERNELLKLLAEIGNRFNNEQKLSGDTGAEDV